MKDKYLEYLDSLAARGSKPGLERIFQALFDLGDPQKRLTAIQVTGTNGKGSYCKMLGDILRLSSYKIGVFSSPHLELINECITLDGGQITDAELSDIIMEAKEIIEKHELTQFEALTVIAILYFAKENTDAVIMEVGMGGALDATNVFDKNIMSVILGVSLDHTSYLGSTVKDIAREKSGIMKKGCPVFLAADDPDVVSVVESRAGELGCTVVRHRPAARIISARDDRTVFSYLGEEYTLNVGADYQVENAEKVLSSLEILRDAGYKITTETVKKAFLEFYRPARYEILSTSPYILYDGAHNPDGVDALVRNIRAHFGDKKFDIAVGIMADKDVDHICRALSSVCKTAYTVTAPNPRAMQSDELCKRFSALGTDAVSCVSFDNVLCHWDRNNPLLCAGSLYSYAEFKRSLQRFKLL